MSSLSSGPPSGGKESPRRAPEDKSDLWSLAYSGTQLAASVLLGVYAGYRLDKRWDTSPWLILAGAALGLLAGLYGFLKPFFRSDSRDQGSRRKP